MASDRPSERDLALFRSKLAQVAQDYDDMCHFTQQLVEYTGDNPPATLEECELLDVAFHRAVTDRRDALRVIQAIEQNESSPATAEYRQLVVQEIKDLCQRAHQCIGAMSRKAVEIDCKVLLAKMQGDYHRYLCECGFDETNKAKEAYDTAANLAAQLTVAHPLRLSIALAQTVLLMEHMQQTKEAEMLASSVVAASKSAVEAVAAEPAYRGSKLTLQLLENKISGAKRT